jgi:CDP-diacylglycerol--serine O-phosphatidyltransferase
MAVRRIRRRPARTRFVEAGRKKIHTVRTHGLFLLPNLFTTASLFCAFLSIVQAMDGNFGISAAMVFLSMIFDGMDGRVARLTHTQSEFGVQFDSIADMTAFGVAPALVMYKFTLFSLGSLGWAACFVYCLCAGIRLARFNCNVTVVDKRFFQGLPSPAAAALLAGFVWLAVENKLPVSVSGALPVLAMLITLYAGFTMVSNAPFFSGKSGVNLKSLKSAPFVGIVAAGLLFVLFSSNMSLSLFILFCLYALSGYAYQGYLFFMDRPNPVLPSQAENEADESSQGVQPQEPVRDKEDAPRE